QRLQRGPALRLATRLDKADHEGGGDRPTGYERGPDEDEPPEMKTTSERPSRRRLRLAVGERPNALAQLHRRGGPPRAELEHELVEPRVDHVRRRHAHPPSLRACAARDAAASSKRSG